MLSQNFVRCKFLDVFLVLSPFLRTSAISRVLFNVLREKQAWEPQQAQSAEEKEGLKRPRGLCAEISISFSVRIMASFGLNWQLQEPSCPNHGAIRTPPADPGAFLSESRGYSDSTGSSKSLPVRIMGAFGLAV